MRSEVSRELSEKIARLVESESRNDNSAILSAIERINLRLDKLEETMNAAASGTVVQPHPSLDKFVIAEAVVETLRTDKNEKACAFEPNGKPCDHCSMCNSRGF